MVAEAAKSDNEEHRPQKKVRRPAPSAPKEGVPQALGNQVTASREAQTRETVGRKSNEGQESELEIQAQINKIRKVIETNQQSGLRKNPGVEEDQDSDECKRKKKVTRTNQEVRSSGLTGGGGGIANKERQRTRTCTTRRGRLATKVRPQTMGQNNFIQNAGATSEWGIKGWEAAYGL